MEWRFGITMRITNADGYDEPRDTIAQDWSTYMTGAFPKSKFLFIPNIGKKAVDFIKKWDINALIISGGDDIGVTPERDITEIALIKHTIDANLPIIAVCRGMQMIHTYFDGKLINGDKTFVEQHRAIPHNINFANTTREVNSYHTNLINEDTLSKEFNILARCSLDKTIEAFEGKNILAMMWHPERDINISDWNKKLIEDFINKINGN
ncbi:MAG: gamma-glutamyl-gamma-aminobutyrate hydrolase family protein [Salinivirgaceae bacterium]|jgi:gamma-glutamyl-gamma-aminobutyrate hydrolase PuuD|nr:gamma-glutamyl-gamma-aminobutyrate hydrolase family protein [Salinivirgaceae bacterium]